jgi:hypothetical protein
MLPKLSVMLLGVAATLYVSSCLLLVWGQTKLIFLPDSYIKSTPQAYGLDYSELARIEFMVGGFLGRKHLPLHCYIFTVTAVIMAI